MPPVNNTLSKIQRKVLNRDLRVVNKTGLNTVYAAMDVETGLALFALRYTSRNYMTTLDFYVEACDFWEKELCWVSVF